MPTCSAAFGLDPVQVSWTPPTPGKAALQRTRRRHWAAGSAQQVPWGPRTLHISHAASQQVQLPAAVPDHALGRMPSLADLQRASPVPESLPYPWLNGHDGSAAAAASATQVTLHRDPEGGPNHFILEPPEPSTTANSGHPTSQSSTVQRVSNPGQPRARRRTWHKSRHLPHEFNRHQAASLPEGNSPMAAVSSLQPQADSSSHSSKPASASRQQDPAAILRLVGPTRPRPPTPTDSRVAPQPPLWLEPKHRKRHKSRPGLLPQKPPRMTVSKTGNVDVLGQVLGTQYQGTSSQQHSAQAWQIDGSVTLQPPDSRSSAHSAARSTHLYINLGGQQAVALMDTWPSIQASTNGGTSWRTLTLSPFRTQQGHHWLSTVIPATHTDSQWPQGRGAMDCPRPQACSTPGIDGVLLRLRHRRGSHQREQTVVVRPGGNYLLTRQHAAKPLPAQSASSLECVSGLSQTPPPVSPSSQQDPKHQHQIHRTQRPASSKPSQLPEQHLQLPLDGAEGVIWTVQPLLTRPCMLVADLAMVAGRQSSVVDDQVSNQWSSLWHHSQHVQPSMLVYTTSRSWSGFEHMWRHKQHVLQQPDVLILAGGTRIAYRTASGEWQEDSAWRERLDRDLLWDRQRVVLVVQQVSHALNSRTASMAPSASEVTNRDAQRRTGAEQDRRMACAHGGPPGDGRRTAGGSAGDSGHAAASSGWQGSQAGARSPGHVMVRCDARSEQNSHRVRLHVRTSAVDALRTALQQATATQQDALPAWLPAGQRNSTTSKHASLDGSRAPALTPSAAAHRPAWPVQRTSAPAPLQAAGQLQLPWKVVVHPAAGSGLPKGWCAVDILPWSAGEGPALQHVLGRFRIAAHPEHLPVVVAGPRHSVSSSSLAHVCTHAVLFTPRQAQGAPTAGAAPGPPVPCTAETSRWGAAGLEDGLEQLGFV